MQRLLDDQHFVAVPADQCQFGLRQWLSKLMKLGNFHKKPTCFLATRDSALPVYLNRLCDGTHQHAPVIGGSKITELAGRWPEELGQAIVSATTHTLAVQCGRIRAAVREAVDSRSAHLTNGQLDIVADGLRLRRGCVDVLAYGNDSTPAKTLMAQSAPTRKIHLAWHGDEMIVYDDAWGHESLLDTTQNDWQYGIIIAVFDDRLPDDMYPKTRACMSLAYMQEALVHAKRKRSQAVLQDEPPRPAPADRPAAAAPAAAVPAAAQAPAAEEPQHVNELPPVRLLDAENPLPARRGEDEVDIGPKPDGITDAQWSALRRLHWSLGHPSPTQLQRQLRMWGATGRVVSAVLRIRCTVCLRIVRPQTNRTATSSVRESWEFGDVIEFDELEVVLSDGTRIMLLGIVD